MKYRKIQKTVTGSLFAALILVATLVVQIPVPATHGYINLGDCFVILAGILLGPLFGPLAAGTGSALTDVITGYAVYAPATFIIKALMALAAALITGKRKTVMLTVPAALAAEIIMTGGYYVFEAFILKYGPAALTGVPMNLIQGGAGIVFSILMVSAINRSERLKQMFYGKGSDEI
ncbi:MAG: ECF transporter S component [Clostridia bacterium]|nr:ECF transporter S component [Clostridia bacterium]